MPALLIGANATVDRRALWSDHATRECGEQAPVPSADRKVVARSPASFIAYPEMRADACFRTGSVSCVIATHDNLRHAP